jgi:hypothetical protein
MQTNTNNVIKAWAPLQTTGGKNKLNILILKVAIDATGPWVLIFFSLVLYCLTVISPCTRFYADIVMDIPTWNSESKNT